MAVNIESPGDSPPVQQKRRIGMAVHVEAFALISNLLAHASSS
jgi:hypothetical protein